MQTDCSWFLVSLTAAKLKQFKAAYRILRSTGMAHEDCISILVAAADKRNAYEDQRRIAMATR